MASPRKIDIIGDCGLTIEVIVDSSKGIDHTHSSSPWKYKITNAVRRDVAIEEELIEEELFNGWLSPTSKITLAPMKRAMAGIPKNATSFAFMYPPELLAERFTKGDKSEEDVCLETFDCHETLDQTKITSAVILGGFAYFDDNFKCITINALSRFSVKSGIDFAGPFEVNKSTGEELYFERTTQPLRLDIFREVGFVRFVWMRPREKIQCKSFVYENRDGAWLFFRDNGTAVAYAVEPSSRADPYGDVGFISEAVGKIKDAKYNQKAYEPIADFRAKIAEGLNDDRGLLNMACRAAIGKELINELLSNGREKDNLSYQDEFGWNPLHYACRFSPKDCDLIKLLVKECPRAVQQSDLCGRYPLHIACDSDTSVDVINALLKAEEVINALLEAEEFNRKIILHGTNSFGLLPIHLACLNGASYSIIKALLDADKSGWTANTPTKSGRLPLHLAIKKKLPLNIVKMLLDADSKLQISGLPYGNNSVDVYQRARGHLPLHIACWNNSSRGIIELLLEKDKSNTTIDETIGGVGGLERSDMVKNESGPIDERPLFRRSKYLLDKSIPNSELADGIVPLHIAMKHGNMDVISLLLQKEIDKSIENGIPERMSTLHRKDNRMRTPLHIACQHNVDPQIIKLLVELDPLKQTTQSDDELGFRPLHYACENKNTSVDVINILCEAEELCIEKSESSEKKAVDDEQNKLQVKERSTHSGDFERNRTPLYLAVKNGASNEVITKLLLPENFTLKGFDDPAMTDLANLVKDNTKMQHKVIDKLSQRLHFGIIVLEFYANVIAILSFFSGSDKLLNGRPDRVGPSLLLFCSVLFILRELLQVKSVGTDYLGDSWSYFELVCVVFIIISAGEMFNMADKQVDDYQLPQKITVILCITAFCLIGQLVIFFRSTFLPFARFVGGLLKILKCLLPFVIVFFLLLVVFVYWYWFSGKGDCRSWNGCYAELNKDLFDFNDYNKRVQPRDTFFGFLIIIVLFNVMIAVVNDAWDSGTKKATQLFWKYRLDKIAEINFADEMFKFCDKSKKYKNFVEYIDNVESISFRKDVSWTKAPFHLVTMKDHYDKPYAYFNPDVAKQIDNVKSLQANKYWAKRDARRKVVGFTLRDELIILCKWLGSCIFYAFLLILGIPSLGWFWPKKCRSGLLYLAKWLYWERNEKEQEERQRDKSQRKNLQTFNDDDTKLIFEGFNLYYAKLDDETEKKRKLKDLLNALECDQIIIFVSEDARAKELDRLLAECNFPLICIHSSMNREERILKYNSFKDLNTRILVSTDLYRGEIDIERARTVINYDFPSHSYQFFHCAEHTGKFGTKGVAIYFISNESELEELDMMQIRFEVNVQRLSDVKDISSYMAT